MNASRKAARNLKGKKIKWDEMGQNGAKKKRKNNKKIKNTNLTSQKSYTKTRGTKKINTFTFSKSTKSKLNDYLNND